MSLKNLLENMVPLRHELLESLYFFPEVNVDEHEINTELIYMLQEKAFQGE